MYYDTPILWTAKEAAAITGGASAADWAATGICLNMKDLRPGDLFFASHGDNLNQAFAKGAAAVVVSGSIELKDNWPALKVPCVFDALRSLARAARFRTHGLVVSVQGKAERHIIAEALSAVSECYEGGRHLSAAIAAMPETCEFGLFGFAPALRPDITVITDCKAAMEAAVLESMPDTAIVLINADDEHFLDLFALVRTSGLRNVFTFGHNLSADARVVDMLEAGNGIRLTGDILGEHVTVTLPAGAMNISSLLAAFILLKLTEAPLKRLAHSMAEAAYPKIRKSSKVSLIEAASSYAVNVREVAFRITNMVDLGFDRRTLVMDKITKALRPPQIVANKDLDIPTSIGNLDVVCAAKSVSVFENTRLALGQNGRKVRLESIPTEVLAPGDIVVFKDDQRRPRAEFSEALRLMPNAQKSV